MNAEFSFKTAVCTEYESLLIACQTALETWREGREEIAKLRSSTKEASDELLRLQANYAKAYSRLEKHPDKCELCGFVTEIGRRHAESIPMLQ
jgi:predicted Zn-ribbon and HTH transcriptional regulator